MDKEKLIIINKIQFGYHTDSYQYCNHLKDKYNIIYICFDTGKDKIQLEGISVIYFESQSFYLKRGFGFIDFCQKYIKKENADYIFIVYFMMASLLKFRLSNKLKIIIDIRTGTIGKNYYKRKFLDSLVLLESMFFNNITIISECLRKKLLISNKKSFILPLGSDSISCAKKDFSKLNLLYVGTLHERRIEDTIVGLAEFIKKDKHIEIHYDILGSGNFNEEKNLVNIIKKNNLENIVTFHGYKSHNELIPFFEKANIGVSYIPKTDFFDCQPPTKTYEYINSNLICLATNTSANEKIINNKNGILHEDNPISFCNALVSVSNNLSTYDNNISLTLKDFTWNHIVMNYLNPYLKSL
jgi:glycosyltransferase involved in cell wall biosynthesis